MNKLCVMLSITVLITAYANAQERDRNMGKHGKKKPPQFALDACQGLVQGDECSFEGRRGEVLIGTCEAPSDKPLACRPQDAPER